MYVYVYAYVCVRVHIHTHTCASMTAESFLIQTSMYLMSVWKVGRFDSCLLGVSARTDINNPKEDALQDLMYGSPR